jgi:hypothetical protein
MVRRDKSNSIAIEDFEQVQDLFGSCVIIRPEEAHLGGISKTKGEIDELVPEKKLARVSSFQ